MRDPLEALEAAVSAVRAAWTSDAAGSLAHELARAQVVAVAEALGTVGRRLDAVRAAVATRIAQESRAELGPDSLAKQQGFRTPAAMIATTHGTSTSDAVRLIRVGDATTPRAVFGDTPAPAPHPHVAEAMHDGRIGAQAATAIITMLDRIGPQADRLAAATAEHRLVDAAPGLTLDQLAKLITRAEATLLAERLEVRDQELRDQRSFSMFERDGMLHISAKLDPESAAPVKTAIEALVTAGFRSERNNGAGPTRPEDADAPQRTLPQRQADALALIASHFSGCSSDLPLDGATVVVRMTLEQCESGAGAVTIDGLDQPVSAATARRMAASGGVIPCVLGGDSEILDWGRLKRLFTPAQKLALAERDGGCASCGLPPGMTKAHHLRWWARDAGPTDLSNGVLLCESCHHRIHDNGWEIRIEGPGRDARVWFIPPAFVDPQRTPRLGGRARYDMVAA